jgi:pyruvate dehydrogenase E1 component
VQAVMEWAFDYMQRDGSGEGRPGWLRDIAGGSVYLRLSTRPLLQPERQMDGDLRHAVIDGGYWLRAPQPGAELAIICSGAVMPEAIEAYEQVLEDVPEAGLLAVTSADRLNAAWHAAERAREGADARGAVPCHIETLLGPLARDAALVTVIDGHPATLAWIGAVRGHHVQALGVEHFGQSGSIPDLYRHHRIDADAILDAAARALLDR